MAAKLTLNCPHFSGQVRKVHGCCSCCSCSGVAHMTLTCSYKFNVHTSPFFTLAWCLFPKDHALLCSKGLMGPKVFLVDAKFCAWTGQHVDSKENWFVRIVERERGNYGIYEISAGSVLSYRRKWLLVKTFNLSFKTLCFQQRKIIIGSVINNSLRLYLTESPNYAVKSVIENWHWWKDMVVFKFWFFFF